MDVYKESWDWRTRDTFCSVYPSTDGLTEWCHSHFRDETMYTGLQLVVNIMLLLLALANQVWFLHRAKTTRFSFYSSSDSFCLICAMPNALIYILHNKACLSVFLQLQTIAPGDTNDIADAVQGLYNTHNRTSPLYKFLEAAGDSLYVAPAVATVDAHCGKSLYQGFLTFLTQDQGWT